ncbi:MAG TPA: PadR family transcriptional regulator [Gemmatimonadaceae bacterium]|jgi:PadR family transcriptional regulator PadR|nr:PadR family transcriptional regulator [Gemmatimonadaceae bacterium]
MARAPTDLLYGTLDMLVLETLAWRPMHGYAISTWIRQRSGGTLEIDDAALYKALHRLEAQEWISAEWGLSENNRRAKYYRLTAAGRKQRRAESQQWKQFAEAVFRILEPA